MDDEVKSARSKDAGSPPVGCSVRFTGDTSALPAAGGEPRSAGAATVGTGEAEGAEPGWPGGGPVAATLELAGVAGAMGPVWAVRETSPGAGLTTEFELRGLVIGWRGGEVRALRPAPSLPFPMDGVCVEPGPLAGAASETTIGVSSPLRKRKYPPTTKTRAMEIPIPSFTSVRMDYLLSSFSRRATGFA